jgi:lipopolysaccharide export system ATP-binding protein
MNDQGSVILSVKDLIKYSGGRPVVNGLSLEVGSGEIVGLLGPNGAGKTTAFYMIVGLIQADSGTIWFQDKDVTAAPVHQRAHMGMGYLAQEPSVFRNMTVAQNIMSILETLPLSRQQQQQRLHELLGELHLTKLADKYAYALSGGERRRLEITRALVTNPSCLMLDEPFANIDPISIEEVKSLVRHLAQKGISILITDHNAREIFSLVHRSYLVYDGKVLCAGSVDQLINDSQVRARYLGENFVR